HSTTGSGSHGQNNQGSNSSSLVFPQSQLISTKLDEGNFFIWKQQVLTTIRGYGLEQYISREASPPSQYTIDPDSHQSVINGDFLLWQRQDQLLASWLLSSLSEGILIQTVGLNTAREIWHFLETSFSSQTTAKLMQYKIQLQGLKKNNLTMSQYLNQMKVCFDYLASAGQPVKEGDKIIHILSGLGTEYDAVMVSVTSRVEPYTVPEIQALLLSYESRLEFNARLTSNVYVEGSQPSVNTAVQASQKKIFSNDQSKGGFRGSPNNRGGRSGGRSYRGRGGRFQGSRPICQVCKVAGHTADRCWYRFDQTYTPQQQQHNNNTQANRNPSRNLTQYANSSAASDFGNEGIWYPDSGASAHVTNELANMNLASEYSGTSRLQVGNGARVPINHIGNGFLKSLSNNKAFLLKELLHVPNITKNLIS
ncbi:Unknown protein, partial [Striga hermonthica]